MFETLYSSPLAIDRHRSGALSQERVRYLKHCADHGAVIHTQFQRAELLLWLAERIQPVDHAGVDLARLQALIQADPVPSQRYAVQATKHGRCWLKFLGWWHQSSEPVAFAADLAQFVAWMRDERGLATSTVIQWKAAATTFLRWFGSKERDLTTLHPNDIDAYFLTYGKGRWSRVSISYTTAMLRTFVRHLASRGRCSPTLADAIFGPRMYALEKVPPALSWEDVRRVIAAINSDSDGDIRDRAILLLMAVYGLRRGEVATLRLDQIHWNARELNITRLKRSKPQTFPLVESVAQALACYIDTVRPVAPYPEIFLRLHAPHVPMIAPSFYWLVSDRLRAVGLQGAKLGPHALRHACASRMLSQGLTLKEIGDHLGHSSSRSTMTYTKVNLTALREVGDFDLGEL